MKQKNKTRLARAAMTLLLALLATVGAWAETVTFNFEDGQIPSNWTNDATYPWTVVSESQGSGHSGTYCIKSGNSGVNSSSSSISATFTFAGDGSISFLGGCWGEGTSSLYDKCIFYIDDVQQFAYGALDTWDTYTFEVEAGTHKFTWSYTKDSSVTPTGDAFFIDDIVIDLGTASACPKPKGLTVNYTGGTTAEVSWTSDADNWQLAFVDGEGTITSVSTVSENPYTLSGLALGTTYRLAVRSICGSDSESEWTSPVSFTTDLCMPEDMCAISITLTDAYGDGGGQIQVVDALTNKVLGTFTNNSAETTYTLAVCDGRAINFVFASTDNWPYENGWVITDVNDEVITEHEGCSSSSNCTAPTNGVIATYTVNCTIITCKKPTNLAATEIGPHSAKLSWTENGEATAWVVAYATDGNNFTELGEITDNPFTLTGLDAETDYTVKVRPVCEAEKWSDEISFTTSKAAPAPTALAATHVTAHSATLNWEGFADEYNVRYGVKVPGSVLAEQDFDDSDMSGWTTIDADDDDYTWVLASASAGVYHNTGVDLTGEGHNGSADFVTSGSYSNYAGNALTPDNYLVSPQVTLGGSITFWACAQDADYPAEHFGVAVSTTGNSDAADFTTIAEWTLTADGTGAKAGSWGKFTVDLSAYAGQEGYVAIRHFNCSDQFLLNIDDIVIEGPNQTLWTVLQPVSGNSVEIEGLDPDTEYTWQVQGIFGDDGLSSWSTATFTTGSACDAPIDLTATDVTDDTATLNWYGSQDSYKVQYRTAASRKTYYFYDFNDGYDAAHAEGWNWDGGIIYGLEDPIYNIAPNENYFLQMGWYTTDEATIVSPELPEYESGAHVEFYYFGYNTANTFQVGFSTTTNDAEAFTWSDPIDAPLSTYTLYNEVLTDGVKYVAFKATASDQSACIFIDDFGIFSSPTPAGEWISVTNVEEPYTLTSLSPDTKYEWQVQGVNAGCDGGVTAWSGTSTFTTWGVENILFAKDGYATYYNGIRDVVLPEGMKAHVVTDGSTTLTYNKVADGDTDGNVVPAGTAVLLQVEEAAADHSVSIYLTRPNVAAYTGTNLLYGSDEDTETTGGAPYYKLTYSNNNDNFGWYWGAAAGGAFTSPAHKAWLALDIPVSAPFLGLPGWEETTGIIGIDNGQLTIDNGEWYTLQGLKIGKKPSTAGVYIHNGRKVLIP